MVAPARRHFVSATMPAFADGGVTIFVRASCTGDSAQGCGAYSSADALDFFLIQWTSASPNQYSVLIIHVFPSFHL
jgi:hypothetical protein